MRARRTVPTPSHASPLVVAIVPAIIVALSVIGYMWAQKDVTVVVDGRPVEVQAQATHVADVLEAANVVVDTRDVVIPAPDVTVDSGDVVVVRHAVPVTLDLGTGEPTHVEVVGKTVADALVAIGADATASAAVAESLDEQLEPGMTIQLPARFVRVSQQETTIAPETVYRRDPSLPLGQRRVVSKGIPGRVLKVYRMVVEEGVEGTPTLSASEVIEEPVDRVVAVGAAPRFALTTVRRKIPDAPTEGRRLTVEATGYSPREPGLDFTTATGARAGYGVIAVDPRVIPLGTRVYVPGYGYAVAADTGGAIKGARIDLCFDSVREAIVWGRRTITITIVE